MEVILPRYHKIHAIGDPRCERIIAGKELVVEEKVDGSNCKFSVKDGKLWFGGHAVNYPDPKDIAALYRPTYDYLASVVDKIPEGLVIYGEAMATANHSTLKYSRHATNHLMLFDAWSPATNSWFNPDVVVDLAKQLGVDGPNILDRLPGVELTSARVKAYLDRESYLGGTLIEGVVIHSDIIGNWDSYSQGPETPLAAKFVSERFKEENKKVFHQGVSIIDQIVKQYATSNRFRKAWLHLRENGELTGELKDIGPMMKEVAIDVEKECADEIMRLWWQQNRKEVLRRITKGVPQFVKDTMLSEGTSNGQEGPND